MEIRKEYLTRGQAAEYCIKQGLPVSPKTLAKYACVGGGDYTDEETGEKRHFDGRLFDAVVFNDAVKEFLALKRKLANYFDDTNAEDIFDYIPPQKKAG